MQNEHDLKVHQNEYDLGGQGAPGRPGPALAASSALAGTSCGGEDGMAAAPSGTPP